MRISIAVRKIALYVFVIFFCSRINAAVSVAQKDNIKPSRYKYARIVYNGEVTADKSLELISTLEKLNMNYPELKGIALYINSFGGDMDGGYMAYEAIKRSALPVTTVNMAMVASAATLFFCAAKERLTMPASTFLLHPAAAENINQRYIRPDELALIKQMNDKANYLLRTVYDTCTDLSESELDKLLYSDSSRLMLTGNEAISRKMATGLADNNQPVDIIIYITDN